MLRMLGVVIDPEITKNTLEIIVSQAVIPKAGQGGIGKAIDIGAITAFIDGEATCAALLSAHIVEVEIL
jgi:hypothetical protein